MIEVRHLTRYYGDFPALRDVSFNVREGEVIGLLGLNGAGKSTTMKVLAGLLPPSDGSVTIDGVDVDGSEELRSRIGYLPEDPPLYTDMTVRAFLAHMARLRGLPAGQVADAIVRSARLTQLEDRLGQVIGTLSHGYRKRVGIAQAVIHDPRLVILDEPISGLDPKQIHGMRQVVRGLAAGRAVIVSSHILSEIGLTCDRALVVHRGRLVAEVELRKDVAEHQLYVEVRDPAGTAQAWLSGRPEVSRVTVDPREGDVSAFELELTGDHREVLVSGLVMAGYGVRLVDTPEGELEKVFLGVITREEVAA
jgi:ABC-2 type transport system ATP-binding protein